MKNELRRSFRKIQRRFNRLNLSIPSFRRSTSEYSYSIQTTYIPSLTSSTMSDGSDDHVFEALPTNDDELSNNNTQDSETVYIPCEFCNNLQTSENIDIHQIRCPRNPNRVRRTNLGTSGRTHESRRRTVSTSAVVASQAAPRNRSPSPTEGFTPPPELLCPITLSLIRDPVVGSDGHTYEREAIMHHLRQTPTSPVTRVPMSIDKLNPNLVVKSLVENYINECKRKKLLHKYKLDTDVKKTESEPFIKSDTCSIYHAEWIKENSTSNDSNIVLIHLTGENAEKIALTNCRLTPHENLVRTLGGVEHNGTGVYLVQEDLSSQTLSQLIRTPKRKFSIRTLDSILFQIVSAMVHLLQAGISHGNLIAENVLIYRIDDESENTLIKLNTLGNVEQDKNDIDQHDLKMKKLTDDNLSEKSDVYAFGKLGEEIYSLIIETDVDYLKERKVSLKRCLEDQSSKRPTFSSLIETFNSFLNSDMYNSNADWCE